jgi:hypothetical protein
MALTAEKRYAVSSWEKARGGLLAKYRRGPKFIFVHSAAKALQTVDHQGKETI